MLPIGSKLELLSAQFSPDGKRIVTASADKTALVWDAATGNLLLILDDHKDQVSSAEFSPDGKKIVTASYDNMVRVWDAESGEHLFTLKGHKDSVFSARFSSDGRKIVSASADGTAKLWDAATRRLIADLSGHEAKVNSAQFSPNGKKIVTASANGTVAIWDTKTGDGKYLGDKNDAQHRGPVISAQFSSDNNYVITASEDKTAKIWVVATGKLLKTLQKHTDKLNSAQFSPDGSQVVTSSRDKTARIWNVADGNVLWTLEGHTNSVKFAQFTPDGKKIITTSFDTTARIWDVATGHADAILKGHKRTVWYAAFSKDSTRVVTASYDGTAKVWDLVTGTMIADLKGHTNWIYSAQFSRDGKKIVTATDDSTIKVWDAVTGSLLNSLKGHRDWVYSALFSPDGKKIVSTSRDKSIKVWDIGTGNQVFSFSVKNNAAGIIFTDYSPDGIKIAFATSKDSVKMIDAVTWNQLPCTIVHPQIAMAKFSPNSQHLITASRDSTAKIWDAASGKPLHTLRGHDDEVLFAAYSPDNTKIVTTSLDRTAIIWDTAAIPGATLIGHTEKVIYASFSPDSKKVITASEDKTARVWEVKSGKLLFTLKAHTDWVNTAGFDSTGKKIITASGDNTVKVWNAENGKLLYTFFAVDSADFLVVDPFNHYDGTENARKLLYFTCGTEKIGLDQVKDQLWVPNLAERITNGDSINAKTLNELDICGLTPEVEDISNKESEYHFTIKARRGGLGETLVFVNGIEAKRYKPSALKNNAGTYDLVISKAELKSFFVPGKNNPVKVKAWTADNAISSRGLIISEAADSILAAPPNLYAVMVGVSDYKGELIDLDYAAIDATDVSTIVADAAKKLLNTIDGKGHVIMYNLTTAKEHYQFPEKKSIKNVFEEIGAKATANDILFIFLSGHGVVEGEKKQFYFMTADAANLADEAVFPDVGISTAELTEWIKPQNIKAQKRILILDACNSGQAINNFVTLGNDKQGYLVAKGDEKSQQIKAIDKLNEKSGLFILSASASTKSAFESSSYSHGYLTYSLLKVIKQQPDILEDGKYLNVSRWFNAAGKMVSDIAKEQGVEQQTQIVSNTDFNIGLVDDEVMAKIKLPEEKPLFAASNFQNSDEAADGDNLGLGKFINLQLNEISSLGSDSKIIYVLATSFPDAFTLSGRYDVKGNTVTVRVSVKKTNETKYRFEEKGTKDKLKELAAALVAKAAEWATGSK